MKSKHAGFTLIELSMAAALGLLVLGVGLSQLNNTGSITTYSYTNQFLLEDFRVAGNYMADMVSSAGYVFPPGSTVTFGASGGYSVKNPSVVQPTPPAPPLATNVWTIGTHPIIAMFVPPKNVTVTCVSSSEGCVSFMAFYALSRADVRSNATGAERPEADPRVPDAWMIYVYSRTLPQDANNATVKQVVDALSSSGQLYNYTAPSISGNPGSGNMLADYVGKNKLVIEANTCFNTVIDLLCRPLSVNSARTVSISIQGKFMQKNIPFDIPGQPLRFEVAARNLTVPPGQ